MIVKNETHCIERCIASVLPIIDSWCIVDTGSTDGTQNKIRELLKEVPGTLHERPWKNFAHNRTESIQLARDTKADYGLIIDADDILVIPDSYELPELTANSYRLKIEYGITAYYRPHLFKMSMPFTYEGVLHEYIACGDINLQNDPVLDGVVYKCFPEGSRSTDPNKFLKDAETLRKAIQDDPKHAGRYTFYLAQSLKDAGKIEKALQVYDRRSRMGGWVEETWMAFNEVARLSEWLNRPEQTIVQAYLKSWENRPQRVEPLYELARFYRSKKDRPAVGYVYAAAGITIPKPPDSLMLDETIYTWRLLYEYAITSWHAGKLEESRAAHAKLLTIPEVTAPEREAVARNLELFK
jgi:glycosyltransferase involved in cell wall biosynthesis